MRAYGTGVFAQPLAIAAALAVTGGILWWTDSAGPLWRGAQDLTGWVAVGTGVAQAAALLPGLSRSGLTIAVALLFGLRRRLAATYSFMLAIPTIVAATAVQAVAVAGQPVTVPASAHLAGFFAAAVAGIGALILVRRILYRARFRYCAYYVWALAVVAAVAAT